MKTYFLLLACLLLSLLSSAQSESEIAAYPDKDGNWIVIVDKGQIESADLRLYDRNGQLLAVRSLPQQDNVFRFKFLTDQHPDSIFRAELASNGKLITQKELNKAILLPEQNWLARVDN